MSVEEAVGDVGGPGDQGECYGEPEGKLDVYGPGEGKEPGYGHGGGVEAGEVPEAEWVGDGHFLILRGARFWVM